MIILLLFKQENGLYIHRIEFLHDFFIQFSRIVLSVRVYLFNRVYICHFRFFLHSVEADKDPTQSLVCEVSKEEKLSAGQIPEQKAPALSSEETITVEAAATKVSSEPEPYVCTKPITEPKAVESCEISSEVPPPQPPAAATAEQCELASPQTMQKEAPQSESLLLEAREPQQVDSQASLLVCTMPAQEAATPITPIGSIESAPIEAKPEIPASGVQDATQFAPISIDSPQGIALTSPVASEAERVIESMAAVTQPLTIDPGERHAEMLLAASEISTVSPVPIQVAESVLQAEPKESVLGAAVAVIDQAIATMVTAVHESTDIASAPTPLESIQLNGSACEVEKRDDVTRDAALIPGLPERTGAPLEAAKESASDVVTTKDVPSEAPPTIEGEILTSAVPLEASSVGESAEQIARTEAAEAKPAEQIAKTETVEAKPAEQPAKMETAEAKPPEQITKTEAVEEKSTEQAAKVETTGAAARAEVAEATSTEQPEIAEAAEARSPSEVPESPTAEQSPSAEESIEVKPPNVPSTPTEATPPTSPSVESALEMEEDAKKILKKSDSTEGADGEGADKKAGKKTVKKVTKKPKAKPEEAAPSAATEGTAADGSQSKVKKTVKTAKKTGTKTLETETSVPETPPPTPPGAGAGAVNAPVPPKRKTKGTNAKGTTGKKPEAEE